MNLGVRYPTGPGAVELLLLKAAMSPGEDAGAAWRAAKRRMGSVASLQGTSYRLLPLLYRNLSEHGVRDPELERLKGVYRHSWYANQMLFREAGLLLGAFEQAGVETIVLKGGAMARQYYDAPGTRPMEDLDVLVRRDQLDRAIAALTGEGWWRATPGAMANLLITRHAAEFRHARGGKVDLHWSPFPQPTHDDPFWADAVGLEIGDGRTRALCPEDQLLHVCVHGVNWNLRTCYWAADAMAILRTQAGSLDWQRLVERARANEMSLALEHALRLVRDEFGAAVPPTVLARLGAIPRSRLERLDHRLALAQGYRGAYLGRNWVLYRRKVAAAGERPRPTAYWDFQRRVWGLSNRRQLVGAVLRKAGEIVTQGVWFAEGTQPRSRAVTP